MSDPYDELIEGETYLRLPPGDRHEEIVDRLHQRVVVHAASIGVAKVLAVRSKVQINPQVYFRPDLAIVTAATHKLWLAAEVVSSGDHHPDTVVKKQIYEDMKLARLWMIDPRYDNVEVYHGGPHGLILREILATHEVLREALLPGFEFKVADLFQSQDGRMARGEPG